jgi:hypothetical protein
MLTLSEVVDAREVAMISGCASERCFRFDDTAIKAIEVAVLGRAIGTGFSRGARTSRRSR